MRVLARGPSLRLPRVTGVIVYDKDGRAENNKTDKKDTFYIRSVKKKVAHLQDTDGVPRGRQGLGESEDTFPDFPRPILREEMD